MSGGNYFETFLRNTGPKLVTKWTHYPAIYARELAAFRTKPVSFLEIGVFRGGSVDMWTGYFLNAERLTFLDIDPACKAHALRGARVEIGDQSDPAFLARIARTYGPFDIVIDDGSHMNAHQITSFEALWPHVSAGGLYIVEDCHTSYWPGFGGGYRAPGSFIEYAKDLVDKMHSWYTDQDDIFPRHDMAQELAAVRFYDSVVVAERRTHADPPTQIKSMNGVRTLSRKALALRGRTSVFKGPPRQD